MIKKGIIIVTTLLGACFSVVAMEKKSEYVIRKGTAADSANLKKLYHRVAETPGGLARTAEEIGDGYIGKLVHNALETGIFFVAESNGLIVGSIIKYKLEPKVFSHVLTEGSILVDPDFQRKGIGSALIQALKDEIKSNRPDIYRVEIIARESNPAVKGLYAREGFTQEGRFEGRIKGVSGKLEADIPMAWFNPNYKAE